MSIEEIKEQIERAESDMRSAQNELAEANRRLDEFKRAGIVKPSEGNLGFIVNGNGFVDQSPTLAHAIEYYEAGNWHPTRKAAELASKRARLTVKLKERIHAFNDGWVPDWSDVNQNKFFLYWRYENECASTGSTWRVRDQADDMYFKDDSHSNFAFTGKELHLIITGEEL